MTEPRPNRPKRSRTLQIVATVVAGLLVFFFANTLQSESPDDAATSVSTSSLLTLPANAAPAATAAPTPEATALPTTAPMQMPTATPAPAPTSTPLPTATAVPPTPVPPTPVPTPDPTAVPAPQPAPEPTAVPEPVVVVRPTVDAAAAAPETRAGAVAPEATVAPEPTPTDIVVLPTATPEPTAAVAPTPEPTATAIPAAAPLSSVADLENYVLGEINKVRANAGLGPLVLDPGISQVSRDWSQTMATGGFFEHRPSEQLNTMMPSGWRQWGENIASAPDIFWAQSSLEASPGHYENMVGPFTHVGVGVYVQGGQVWVTQNFVRL